MISAWEKLLNLLPFIPLKRPNLYNTQNSTQSIGDRAEQLAEQYLHKQGLQTKQKNYRCKTGEIDIVMEDKQTLVFVEVRSRKRNDYGSALESVNRFKQQRLIKTAKHYLQAKKLSDKRVCRFDVVSVSNEPAEHSEQIQWITDAFSASY